MSITLTALMKQRYDTAANWTTANPTLLAGEIGIESDTKKWKLGTGAAAWTSLGYIPGLSISAYPLVNADISATAEIAVSKLADGTPRQLLQTDAAGTGVEWASNIDIPGTLDVTGATTFDNNVIIQGDLTVNGTETIINTQTLDVEDKNIVIGKVVTPSDITADGGGITLKGTTDKTINWIDATDAWTFSEHVNIVSTKEYRIAGTKVLDATSIGSAVVSSSLTSVGTIATGVWNGTTIGTAYGGTGQTTYTDGQLLIGKNDGTLAKATLTAGSNITITNGNGSITISATSIGGTVTSVDVSGGTGLTATGGPITSSGTITIDLDNTAVTPASYTYASITVDAQGRLTAASSGTTPLTSSDIGVTVQGFDADTAKLDVAQTFTAAQTFGDDVTLSSLNGGPISGARNRIINGDMRIDQRNAGASVAITIAGNYTVDRWSGNATQNSKYTVQQDTSNPAGFTNSLKVTSSSSYSVTSSDVFWLAQEIEGLNTSDLAWGSASAKNATLSFWVQSSLTGTFGGALRNSGGNRSYPFTYTISAANTWEYKTVSIAGDTSGTWLSTNEVGIRLNFGLGVGSTYSGTAGAWAASNFISATGATSVVGTNGATFYITGVQLEPGTVATPFERRSYGQELALCQRYYEEVDGQFKFDGNLGGATISVGHTWFCQVSKRSTPTVSVLAESGGNVNNIASVTPKSNNGAFCIWEYTNGTTIVARAKAAIIRFVAEL